MMDRLVERMAKSESVTEQLKSDDWLCWIQKMNNNGVKYDLGNAQMFVIEGMDKIQKVIEENRRRKLTPIRIVGIPEIVHMELFAGK